MKRGRNSLKTGRILRLMWKAELERMGRKHNTDTDGTKGDGEGQTSRVEGRRTDGNRRRQTENVREQILRNKYRHFHAIQQLLVDLGMGHK